MSIGRPKADIALSEDERIQLSSLAGSRSLPHAIVARANVVLWSADGITNSEKLRLVWDGRMRRSENVFDAFWSGAFRDFMTNFVPADHVPSRMKRSQSC